jgi:hypothetical protein
MPAGAKRSLALSALFKVHPWGSDMALFLIRKRLHQVGGLPVLKNAKGATLQRPLAGILRPIAPGDVTQLPGKGGKPVHAVRLDGCGGLTLRATSYRLTTRDTQGRQQADTPLRGYKVGFPSVTSAGGASWPGKPVESEGQARGARHFQVC